MNEQFLESTYENALIQNEISTTRWSNFKEEHEAVKARLLTFRDGLKHDIMVPVGKIALLKGQLVHTNEILISLGDSWFVKQSAADAAQLCDRRIKYCDTMLDKYEKERDLLVNRKSFSVEHDLFGSDEIIEEYDEEKEAVWREKHKENIRRYKEDEVKKRQEDKVKNEEDILKLLDSLEKEEELEDEMNRLDLQENTSSAESSSEDDDDDDDDDSESEEEITVNNVDDMAENTSELDYSKNNLCIDSNFLSETKPITKSKKETSRKISFAENLENVNENNYEPICIKFKHSHVKPREESNNDRSTNEIVSPSDIYKSLAQSLQGPKSILKKSSSASADIQNTNSSPLNEDNCYDLNEVRKDRSLITSQVKIGDVSEKLQDPTPTQQSSRPVSKFKAARLAGKKS